ncbi:MAG TPA: Sec-independent protein translocase protein TatB [Syntrophorhabdaceae bacterium]|nr:Sec-independent protein translocase protein TatB [Syntrophorhabdaceae bacterium]
MFGIGFPELIVIIIVALIVLGPAKLPELARSFGKALREFRHLTDDMKRAIEDDESESHHSDEKPFKDGEEPCTKPEKS